MSKQPKRTTADIHRMIADQVIEMMKTSGTDWSKSWTTPAGNLPTSMSTGKQYNGINLLILGMTRAVENYGSHHWATYNQWFTLGGGIREGKKIIKPSKYSLKDQKGTTVILYKPIQIDEKIDGQKTGEKVNIRLLRTFTVFNADQVDGYTAPAVVDEVDHSELDQPDTLADQLASRAGADVRFNDPASAFYVPAHDFINMPRATQFDTLEDYAATLLHELTHWTGHATRCDRKMLNKNGTKDYAKEELVAELGAAMMAGSLGIEPQPREDHAKYLAGWMRRLKDEPSVIFSAAAKANTATQWIFDAAKVQQSEVKLAA